MKILHVLHSFPPDSYGGVETYVGLIAREQAARGHAIAVLAGGAQVEVPFTTDVESIGIHRLPRPSSRSLSNVDILLANRAALERALEPWPEVVHIHHWENLPFHLADWSKNAGAAVVATLHDDFAFCPFYFRMPDRSVCAPSTTQAECAACASSKIGLDLRTARSEIDRRDSGFAQELRKVDALLCISASHRDDVAARPAAAGLRLRLLPLPAPTLARGGDDVVPRLDLPAARMRIVTWGGLVPGKGLGDLVEAVAALRRPSDVAVDHYGGAPSPSFADALVSRARLLSVRLRLRGPYRSEDVAGLFSRYDLAAFPSLYAETHGYAVDEALAAGLPVLVSDRGAPKERIGSRGLVYAGGDVSALRARLAELLEDPSTLVALRAGEPKPPVRLADHVDALEAVYRECLSARLG